MEKQGCICRRFEETQQKKRGHESRQGDIKKRGRIGENMRIINLTPHTINIVDEAGNKIVDLPSEGEARAVQKNVNFGHLGDVPLVRAEFGEPIGLPEPAENTFYIVSAITANAAKAVGRTTDDLLLTAETVRNEKNQIIGCKALAKI